MFAEMLQVLGPVLDALDCRIVFDDGRAPLDANAFVWSRIAAEEDAIILRGVRDALTATWRFVPWGSGFWVTLHLQSDMPLHCAAISNLIVDYAPQTDDLSTWWVPNFGESVYTVGLHRVSELTDATRTDKVLRGAFPNSHEPGLFLGTRFPQTHEHGYSVERLGDAALRFISQTRFRESIGAKTHITSEATWVCAQKTVSAAVAQFAEHIAPLPSAEKRKVPVGWNSWDYYFSSVSLDDLIENMAVIRADGVLREQITHIVLDMGWEHVWGEWQPNYRFPGGLERVVAEITSRGFVPGIWVSPICVQSLSKTALRHPDILVKNAHGDPQPSLESNHFIVDPTHPAGEAFLREIYARLHRIGFRLFKVDYVNDLTRNRRYHDPNAGPYDAMRALFRIIRECVGDESHIIGCSLPAETGAGIVNSGRIGIDIHNHWAHVEWVCDFLQTSWWLHDRVWINDTDFLVVRGRDTSLEAETNVTNPNAHNPKAPRWRGGPVFTLDEARTWASMVAMSGGSVFLSDRLSMLNIAAHTLIRKVIQPTGAAAMPLDLCDNRRASLWLQRMAHETRLTLINWSNEVVTHDVNLTAWTNEMPTQVKELWSGRDIAIVDGNVNIHLPAHGCAVLIWENLQ